MRAFILAVGSIIVVASPAVARDGSGYVGIEGGILFPRNTNYLVNSTRVQSVPTGGGLLGQTVTTSSNTYGSGFIVDYKKGVDLDAIAGYDFGFIRLEGELGYKRTRDKSFTASSSLLSAINTAPIGGVTSGSFAFGNKTRVMSAMLNGLLDYEVSGVRIYGGGGAGRARVKTFNQRDNAWAFQGIVGVSTAISPNIDLGLKYRYFQTTRLHFSNGAVFTNSATGASSTSTFGETGKFRSHSLLASLIFNFGGSVTPPPPPPPPAPVVEASPPPPPPATQTCVDGTVIEATMACPVPPPPPPPPPPPAQGERG